MKLRSEVQKMQDLVKGIPQALHDHCRVQSTFGVFSSLVMQKIIQMKE